MATNSSNSSDNSNASNNNGSGNTGKKILLIISGGIAAYKTPELIRCLQKCEHDITVVMTAAAKQFVSGFTLASISGNRIYDDLFHIETEGKMDHITLVRDTDLIVVAPASANIMAKMALGLADEIASTLLLAANKSMIIVPSMNTTMWENQATQNNLATLKARKNITIIAPHKGRLACGEVGMGKMADIGDITALINDTLSDNKAGEFDSENGKLSRLGDGGRKLKIIVTAGSTREMIDPVRYIANRSSGKQGYAIAEAAADAGYESVLITGVSKLETPSDINKVVEIESAADMYKAIEDNLPADILIMAAAVADWRVKEVALEKIKKSSENETTITLVKNPDILKNISTLKKNKPRLVIGFAAETENLVENAGKKLISKKCDWLLANNVANKNDVLGGDSNLIKFFSKDEDAHENWERMSKNKVAEKLIKKIDDYFNIHKR